MRFIQTLSFLLLIVGLLLPFATTSYRLGSRSAALIGPALLADDLTPDDYRVCGIVVALFTNGQVILGIIALLTLAMIPIASSTRKVFEQWKFPLHKFTTNSPTKSRLWAFTETWNLLPVFLLGVGLLALKQPARGAIVWLHSGFWLLVVAVTLPIVVQALANLLRNEKCLTLSDDKLDLPLALTYVSIASFICGIFGTFVYVNEKMEGGTAETIMRFFSSLRPGPYSIVSAAIEFLNHGLRTLGVVVLTISVIFPIVKLSFTMSFLHFDWPISAKLLALLKRAGPWSMLDCMIAIMMVVAYLGFPGGTRVEIGWGYWCYLLFVLTNSLALGALEVSGKLETSLCAASS